MKKRDYEDDYEDDATGSVADDTVRRMEIQQESLHLFDWLVAAALALFTGGLMMFWAFPGLSPHAWNDMAIGSGVRPIDAIFPGFWTSIARWAYSALGVTSGTHLMIITGKVVAGVTVGLVYLLLRQILSITVRVRLLFARRRLLVIRGTALLGALFFACSDPVWRAGQAFTSPLLLLFMTVLALELFFGFLMSGRMARLYTSTFILGLLSAETPLGFFLLATVLLVYLLAFRHGAIAEDSPLLNPIVEQSSKWHLTFLYAFGLILGIAANCIAFISFDGFAVFDVSGADMPLLYATRWWTQFTGAATPLGWLLGLGICVLPFVVAAVLLPRAVDEEQFLPYHIGAVFFVVGALSFAQLAELAPLWFWTWTDAAKIVSPYFLLVLVLFSAASVVFALAVMAVEVCCRDHRRLVSERFAELNEGDGDDDEDGEGGKKSKPAVVVAEVEEDAKPFGVRAWLMIVLVPLLLIAAVLPGRRQVQTRRMLSIIHDYAMEVLKECGEAKCIFTDGSFDSWLELLAAAGGRSLNAISMMADNSPRQQYIRQRGVANQEDRITLSMGGPMTLRSTVRDHREKFGEMAVQLGFEVWKREGLEVPPCSGVLSRPAGMSEKDRLAGVDAANALAERILAVYFAGGPSKSAGELVNELFLTVQWRIARIARMRAERADRAGKTELALKDVGLSDRLDHNNAALARILKDIDKMRERTLHAVTPRESLQLALARADFGLARRFAEPILVDDPDDPNANFGVGMSYYMQKQWARAEEFLRKVLVKKPKEPAVWNNLAMICLYTKRYDEGLRHAKRALELIPESASVKDTIKQLEKAKEGKSDDASGKGAATNAPAAAVVATNAPVVAAASPREAMEAALAAGDFDATRRLCSRSTPRTWTPISPWA